MCYPYLKAEDWQAFETKFESAFAFLLNQSLYRERIALKLELVWLQENYTIDKVGRKMWVEQRVKELDTLNLTSKIDKKE